MFKATRILNQKTFENRRKCSYKTGKHSIYYFKDKFVDSDQDVIPPFQGETEPFRKSKQRRGQKGFKSLSNNKAPGKDNINGELLKYDTPLLYEYKTVANICNRAFEKHEYLEI